MEREKNRCRAWYEGDPILEEYHDNEWCKVNHDDNFQFEMLCLEGASVGLSWKTILHKRANYRAFLQSIGMVNDHLEDCKYRDC